MPKAIDLTGKRFGRLTVVEKNGKNKQGAQIWHCKCDCGGTNDVVSAELNRGHVVSCGCYRKEVIAKQMELVKNGIQLRKIRAQGTSGSR